MFKFSLLIFSAGIIFTACTKSPTAPATPAVQQEKVGDTVLTGTIFEQSGRYYLKNIVEKPQETLEIDSYSIDFQSYIGKQVHATGQYSGDTLFISKIEE